MCKISGETALAAVSSPCSIESSLRAVHCLPPNLSMMRSFSSSTVRFLGVTILRDISHLARYAGSAWLGGGVLYTQSISLSTRSPSSCPGLVSSRMRAGSSTDVSVPSAMSCTPRPTRSMNVANSAFAALSARRWLVSSVKVWICDQHLAYTAHDAMISHGFACLVTGSC